MSELPELIPADSFLLDGDTALVVTDRLIQMGVADWVLDDRPCESCDGKGSVRTECGPECDNGVHEQGRCQGSWWKPCPDCDGTGRHTFDIGAWLCDVYDCAKCIGGVHKRRDILTVHVIDVLPIIYPESCRSKAPDQCVEMAPGWDNMLWLSAEQEYALPITLPPAAEPGMWLVRLAVHS